MDTNWEQGALGRRIFRAWGSEVRGFGGYGLKIRNSQFAIQSSEFLGSEAREGETMRATIGSLPLVIRYRQPKQPSEQRE